MTDATARLSLPLLVPGQAQKEMFHNEALTLLDLAVQPSVRTVGLDQPPVAPVVGDAWIVGDAPTGDWAGHPGALAGWTAGGWRFLDASEGMTVWDLDTAQPARRTATGWEVGTLDAARVRVGGRQVIGPQCPAIGDPAGGGTVDAEARAGLASVLAALRAHGLVAA